MLPVFVQQGYGATLVKLPASWFNSVKTRNNLLDGKFLLWLLYVVDRDEFLAYLLMDIYDIPSLLFLKAVAVRTMMLCFLLFLKCGGFWFVFVVVFCWFFVLFLIIH